MCAYLLRTSRVLDYICNVEMEFQHSGNVCILGGTYCTRVSYAAFLLLCHEFRPNLATPCTCYEKVVLIQCRIILSMTACFFSFLRIRQHLSLFDVKYLFFSHQCVETSNYSIFIQNFFCRQEAIRRHIHRWTCYFIECLRYDNVIFLRDLTYLRIIEMIRYWLKIEWILIYGMESFNLMLNTTDSIYHKSIEY